MASSASQLGCCSIGGVLRGAGACMLRPRRRGDSGREVVVVMVREAGMWRAVVPMFGSSGGSISSEREDMFSHHDTSILGARAGTAISSHSHSQDFQSGCQKNYGHPLFWIWGRETIISSIFNHKDTFLTKKLDNTFKLCLSIHIKVNISKLFAWNKHS